MKKAKELEAKKKAQLDGVLYSKPKHSGSMLQEPDGQAVWDQRG